MVGNLATAHVDGHLVCLLVDSLLKDRLKRGIESLADILKQDREAHLDTLLDGDEELGGRQLDHLQAVVLLLGFEPLVALGLRVNDQWPATIRVGRDDTIVDGEVISWQALDVPSPDPERVTKDLLEGPVR